jgi:hypothetical protein
MASQKTRASEDLLNELHDLQARSLLASIKKYKGKEDEMPPALFAQVNKFLKDNGIDRAITPGDPTSLLEEEAPFFDNNVHEGDFG